MTTTTIPLVIYPQELCKLLGYSRTKLYRLIQSGQFTFKRYHIGGRWAVSRQDVERYLGMR